MPRRSPTAPLHDLATELHAPLLHHVRRRMRGSAEAEDIAQESWVKATAALQGDRPVGHWRGYLYRIARNLMIDHHRRSRNAVEVQADERQVAAVPDPRPSPETMLVTRDELRRMDRIIAAMPARPREVFRLARIEGLSFAEIGRRLGLSRQTVHEHMTRALLALQLAAGEEY